MHHLGGFFARPRPFLAGDFVTTDSGTGLVHMSPDHGEDDFDLCKANGLDPVFAVEGDGKYREDWGWLGGQGSVINPKFNAPDGPICSDLRERSEEHTSELQSLMRISYAVFCLKKKKKHKTSQYTILYPQHR